MTTTTTIADALRAGIELLSSSREWFGDIDGSMCEELTAALRQYDDVLEKLRAALQAADRNAEMLEAARELLALKEELEHPQPPSAQPTLTAEIVEAGTPNMFWDEDPDGDGYVGNTLQEIVEIACDDLTSADGHLYVDVGCARKLPTIAVRAWIDGEGALHWEEVPDTWPWGDE